MKVLYSSQTMKKLSTTAPDLILSGSRARDAYAKLSEIAPAISMDIDPAFR